MHQHYGDCMKVVTVRVPDDLHRSARVLSVQRGESLNSVLIDLLRKWVEHFAEEKS